MNMGSIMGLIQMVVENDLKQVVSKQRIMCHGEVYTNEWEVNPMLDLVKQETERIESRFLDIYVQKLRQFNDA